MPITVETCVASHIGDRHEQQDRVGVFAHPRERGMLMAVLADGMGGHTGGAMAAEQVLLKARQNFDDYSPRSEDAGSLLNTIVNDAHLIIRLTRLTSEKEPHSTAVVLVLQPGEIRWAHCGDSRLYHFRDSCLMARSEDHSVVGDLQRKGQLNDAGARIHPRRNVLLSCLGSERPPEVTLSQGVRPQAGDSFLLCSDGLWGLLSDAEIAAEVCARRARDAAEVLVERARKRGAGAGDNISLALIKLVEAPASQP
ncbi:PP2C family protein-serine/threonine phosphatase [Aromatoleum petrolei]|uniref:Serine/threonine-protein phosphatase n=1 Tax=Aromatoleum petrolei TaxID=76116 RepID=A0ABX1MM79_9RHOO|nr:protein phosphatase 2C domain-containing protein [Aromatoleum petrolei]NMF87796.1 serine/threonine-protein phosphatase [Aromatoleum petrolei]QTQ35338.1 Serine/threonine protein phosphatase [Aromatoleum petrolei]